jgi:hypothetical protein
MKTRLNVNLGAEIRLRFYIDFVYNFICVLDNSSSSFLLLCKRLIGLVYPSECEFKTSFSSRRNSRLTFACVWTGKLGGKVEMENSSVVGFILDEFPVSNVNSAIQERTFCWIDFAHVLQSCLKFVIFVIWQGRGSSLICNIGCRFSMGWCVRGGLLLPTLLCSLQRYYLNITIIWDGRICMFAVLLRLHYLLFIKFISAFYHVCVTRPFGVAQYSKFTC